VPVFSAAGVHATKPVTKPKLGALLPVVDAILEADWTAAVKRRHMAEADLRASARRARLTPAA
jgi:hypothetical protein